MDSPDEATRAPALELFDALIPAQRALVEKGQTARKFVISTPEQDRHKTVFLSSAWDLEAYRSNPVVLWAHNHHDLPLGLSNGAELGADNKLRSSVVMLPESESPFAARVDRLIELGIIRGASVGGLVRQAAFVEDEDTGKWWVEFREVELIEWSVVSVPSNRGAMLDAVRAAQASGMNAAQSRNFLEDFINAGMTNQTPEVAPRVVADPWQKLLNW